MAPMANTMASRASFLTESNPYKIFDAPNTSSISNIEHHTSTFKELTTLDPSFKRILEHPSHSTLHARANDLINQMQPSSLTPQIPTSAVPPTMAIVVIVIVVVGLIGMILWGLYCKYETVKSSKKTHVETSTTVGEAGEQVVRGEDIRGYEMESMGKAEHDEFTEETDGDLGMAVHAREMV
ncbi:hypothetical protein N431DRAFT_511719 [Stipitochalara longipes BDJ]|nr:hypothetical protein N431DRAFT_511719 [Stipitochalara longipes BDJ]